jgi:anti-sigma B factor antagonist
MTITERGVGDVRVLDISGPITLAENTERLGDKVRSLLQQGHKKIVLNLAGVAYVDSAGLGELVRAHSTAARQGGRVKLVGITKKINDLLIITKLATVFDLYESEPQAVTSFSGPRE